MANKIPVPRKLNEKEKQRILNVARANNLHFEELEDLPVKIIVDKAKIAYSVDNKKLFTVANLFVENLQYQGAAKRTATGKQRDQFDEEKGRLQALGRTLKTRGPIFKA